LHNTKDNEQIAQKMKAIDWPLTEIAEITDLSLERRQTPAACVS
jgi:hypothetical protein